jgi:hypothetical protein
MNRIAEQPRRNSDRRAGLAETGKAATRLP